MLVKGIKNIIECTLSAFELELLKELEGLHSKAVLSSKILNAKIKTRMKIEKEIRQSLLMKD